MRRVPSPSPCLLLLFPVLAWAGPFGQAQQHFVRYRDALAGEGSGIERAFRVAGSTWPPPGIFVRAFKAEGELELWAAPPRGGARWVRVRTFEICASSGALGPKTFQGDLQVPEGFYHIDRFNPTSAFHLSLGLNYPNRSDRARTPRGVVPGGDIFIHGGCATIGCLPLRDAPISTLYVAAVAAHDAGQARIPVHVFPCRMDRPTCVLTLVKAAAGDATKMMFWEGLRPGFEAFEATGVPPSMRAEADGSYTRR